jgi:Ca-activated chloride channel family protein
MRKQSLSFSLLAVALLFCSLCLSAQTTRPRPTDQKNESSKSADQTPAEPAVSVDTTEVLLPVTARDRAGRFVADLKAEDFVIYEDDVPQQLTSFDLRRLPVHVLLMIDTSSSVQRELDDFKATALRFAEKLNDTDSLSLIRFDDKIELVMDWTRSRTTLKRALNRLGTGMFTRFNDAMYLAARATLGQVTGRKAIIVFTDGVDSGRGSKSYQTALRALLEAEAPVYVVSKTRIQRRADLQELDYYENGAAGSRALNQTRIDGLKLSLEALEESEQRLTRLAEETGGRLFLPQRFENLDDAYQEVADELRNQYVIFYTPTDTRRDGRYRRIRVRINRPSCYATTRLGYYLR